MDEKDYGLGAQILRSLGVKKIRLLTNQPSRRVGLPAYGLEIVEEVPLFPAVEEESQSDFDFPDSLEVKGL